MEFTPLVKSCAEHFWIEPIFDCAQDKSCDVLRNVLTRNLEGDPFDGMSAGFTKNLRMPHPLAVGMNQALSNWVSKGAERPLVKGGVNAPPAKTRRAARL